MVRSSYAGLEPRESDNESIGSDHSEASSLRGNEGALREESDDTSEENKDFTDSEDDQSNQVFQVKKVDSLRYQKHIKEEQEQESDEDAGTGADDEENSHGESEKVSRMGSKDQTKNPKLKRLDPKKLVDEEKKIRRTGVCYLSRIPPFMKPSTLRSILSRFGEIDRLFLKPEDTAAYKKRVKYGGNKKKNYTEGWIEFVKKRCAKLCASTLNGNKLGGRKTSYYYDDIINIKYLPGFKWIDLTQQIAKENEIRQAKLALELSQQNKLNKTFVENVEKSKMINNIKNKRKSKATDEGKIEDPETNRFIKQRKVTSTRADADEKLKENTMPNEKLNDVLSKIF